MAEAPATTAPETTEGAGGAEPELSVILVTDGLELIREVLGSLSAQTAADRMELVIVTPTGSIPPGSPEPAGFSQFQVVEFDSRTSPPGARAAGVFAASAPVVVFSETHCFPDPDWAASLIEAHRGPWAAVGPEIHNANPGRSSSWGNLYVDYAAWVAPLRAGPVEDLPGHNSSYKRALLLEYGDDLPELMSSESIMHWDLRSRGHRLYIEPRAKVRRNITGLVPAAVEHFQNGRCFGSLRSRGWSGPRRALYAAACPLIPLIRLRRIVREARRSERGEVLPRALPAIAGSLLAHAAGELAGYATGRGDAIQVMSTYELDRELYAEA